MTMANRYQRAARTTLRNDGADWPGLALGPEGCTMCTVQFAGIPEAVLSFLKAAPERSAPPRNHFVMKADIYRSQNSCP